MRGAALAPAPPPVLAVDLGGSSVKAEILARDLAGSLRCLGRAAEPTPPHGGAGALDAVVAVCRRLLREPGGSDVGAVGLAVPGVVDAAEGVVRLAANLGWRDQAVTAPIREALGRPVALTHDATAAGLAEWRHGAGRGVSDLLVVVIGTGIAATIVAGGAVVRGGLGQAGELGHVVVRPQGPPCRCGQRGCLESLASARAIALAYAERSAGAPGSADVACAPGVAAAAGRAARDDGTVLDAADVAARLGADPVADAVWEEATAALADGLLIACTLLGPARIVLGGGLANAGETLLGPVRRRLSDVGGVAVVPPLVLAELGDRAGVVGAGLAAYELVDLRERL